MIRRGKAERDEEFAAFMAQANPSLMRTAWLLTGSQDQAHELVQAALVKTYAAWHRVRPGEGLAYARRILVNHRTDTWRRTRGEVVLEHLPERGMAPGAVTEDRDVIVRLLAQLPNQQRRVVVLRYYSDLSEQAVADVLGISVGAVKSAASRGLATLRAAHTTPDHHPAATTDGGTR